MPPQPPYIKRTHFPLERSKYQRGITARHGPVSASWEQTAVWKWSEGQRGGGAASGLHKATDQQEEKGGVTPDLSEGQDRVGPGPWANTGPLWPAIAERAVLFLPKAREHPGPCCRERCFLPCLELRKGKG